MQQRVSQQNHGPQIVVDALVDGLRISNKGLNEKCKRALISIGRRAAQHLRRAVSTQRMGPNHRRRTEEVIELIDDSKEISGTTESD